MLQWLFSLRIKPKLLSLEYCSFIQIIPTLWTMKSSELLTVQVSKGHLSQSFASKWCSVIVCYYIHFGLSLNFSLTSTVSLEWVIKFPPTQKQPFINLQKVRWSPASRTVPTYLSSLPVHHFCSQNRASAKWLVCLWAHQFISLNVDILLLSIGNMYSLLCPLPKTPTLQYRQQWDFIIDSPNCI